MPPSIHLATRSAVRHWTFKHLRATSLFYREYRVCIVGGGPSGFYCAKYLTEMDPEVTVDILEKLPTPYGLVRFGVAPDHESTKNVMSTFKEVASRDRVTYRGNVEVGIDITLVQLQSVYNAVVLATGAASDRKLR